MKTTTSKINKSKTNILFWDIRRDVIRSKVGGAKIGQGIISSFGYSLLDQLVGHVSFFQVLLLNVTGKLPDEKLTRWIEATFICLSWPDHRIWCNQIGSFGGSMRASPVSSICAGVLASDSRMYGPGTASASVNFITNALNRSKSGHSVEDIIASQIKGKSPSIPGYARPLAYGDERVTAMEKVTNALNFDISDHLILAYKIQDILYERYGESMNIAGYMAAFLSDQGLSAKECYRIYSLCVNGGVHACYSETYDNPPASFLPLRCDDIVYKGKPARSLSSKS